jgi:hypothetical protein
MFHTTRTAAKFAFHISNKYSPDRVFSPRENHVGFEFFLFLSWFIRDEVIKEYYQNVYAICFLAIDKKRASMKSHLL